MFIPVAYSAHDTRVAAYIYLLLALDVCIFCFFGHLGSCLLQMVVLLVRWMVHQHSVPVSCSCYRGWRGVLEHAVFSGFDIPPVPKLVQPGIINWIESEMKIRIELLMHMSNCHRWPGSLLTLTTMLSVSLFCKRPFRFLIFLTSTIHCFFTSSC